jgi:hypothetical protein
MVPGGRAGQRLSDGGPTGRDETGRDRDGRDAMKVGRRSREASTLAVGMIEDRRTARPVTGLISWSSIGFDGASRSMV